MAAIQGSDIKNVIVACEAGMGSSVLLTTQMSQRLKPYGVTVEHLAVNRIEGRPDVVLCHAGLEARARQQAPDSVVLAFNMFLGDPVFDRLENAIRDDETLTG
ncbi:MAG TPA: PTS lactose transporter subunit IIB [Actinomycetota bacterium]|nr:PTS lactose transporter subunit IIB [Actinomycetota bacterium]